MLERGVGGMNTNQLKYFVSAAEARSFTKAAEKLGLSFRLVVNGQAVM